MNQGPVQFLDLPEKLQRRAIVNSVRVANNRLRRAGIETVELRDFAKEMGLSLAAVERNLRLSSMVWMWEGSNMSVDQYRDILRLFQISDPWTKANLLAVRLGSTSADLETALADLIRERHKCAHEALYGVTAIWVRSLPARVLGLAAVFDILVSGSSVQLRDGNTAFLQDAGWMSDSRLALRFIRERPRGGAEVREGATKALRVSTDVDALFREAKSRCGPMEVLVRQSLAGELVTWAMSGPG